MPNTIDNNTVCIFHLEEYSIVSDTQAIFRGKISQSFHID